MLYLLLASSAFGGPDFGATLRAEGTLDIASDRDGEDPINTATWARAFAKGELPRGDTWFVEGRLQQHIAAGENIEGWWEPALGPTGLDARLGGENSPARLRVGVVEERWGRLQLLPVLDVLNPRDARSGLLTPTAFQKLSIPMATLQLTANSFRSRTTVIPLASADRIWLRGTDWSPLRQGMLLDFYEVLETNNRDQVQGAILQNLKVDALHLDPSRRRAEDATTNLDNLPQALLVNAELAQRFHLDLHNFDLALVAANIRSRTPQTAVIPELGQVLEDETLPDTTELAPLTGALVDVSWPRTTLVGLEASGLAGPLQLRGETGYTTHRVVRLQGGRADTAPQFAAGAGVDYVYGGTFQASIEARWQHIVAPPANLVFAAPDQIQVAAGVRGSLLQEQLIITVGGAYDFVFNELLVRPTVAWRASDNVQLDLSLLVLEGLSTAPPETLQELLSYEAGPLSLWSHNDAVSLAVSFFF